MESLGYRHSNSPTPSGTGERSSLSGIPRARVAKGLVSARIREYQKHLWRQGDARPAYPPSFPRARFEKVQTQRNWPYYNADLYNQQHPRTMSLAIDAFPYTENVLQGRQQDHNKPHSAPRASRAPRVTNLLRLWESKAERYESIRAPRSEYAVSLEDSELFAEQLVVGQADSRPAASISKEALAKSYDTRLCQQMKSVRTTPKTPSTDTSGRQTSFSEKRSTPLGAYVGQWRGNTAVSRVSGGTEFTWDHKLATDFDQETCDSILMPLDSHGVLTTRDASHAVARDIPWEEARNGNDKHLSGSEATDEDSEARKNWLLRGLRTESSSSDDAHPNSRRGRSMTRRETHIESRTDRPNHVTWPLAERREGSAKAHSYSSGAVETEDIPRIIDVRQLSRSADTNMASARSLSPPFHGQSPDHCTRLAHETFYRRATEFLSNSACTVSASPLAQEWQLWKPEAKRAERGRTVGSMGKVQDLPSHTTSTSSSEYYSCEQLKLGSAQSQDGSPTAQIAATPGHGGHDPATLDPSVLLDTVTQTGTVEQIAVETTSGWSDSESIARRRRRPIYPRFPRPVRLERRLRRPVVRKIEVIVSLDGATDLVMDARWRQIGMSGRVQGARGVKPDAGRVMARRG